jgi:hypothetical protein
MAKINVGLFPDKHHISTLRVNAKILNLKQISDEQEMILQYKGKKENRNTCPCKS